MPAAPVTIDPGDARVAAAAGEIACAQKARVTVISRRLAHQIGDEFPGPVAQQGGRAVGTYQSEMAAVAGDQQVGRRRRGGPQRADQRGDQSEHAGPTCPQAQPQPADDDQAEGGSGHRRKHRHRAAGPGHRMGHAQQHIDGESGRAPQRRAEPDHIQQQSTGLQRHDDEGGQRDRDDVGRNPVKPGAVEVVERERDQRDLDHQSGQNHRPERPDKARDQAFIAPLKQCPDRGQ